MIPIHFLKENLLTLKLFFGFRSFLPAERRERVIKEMIMAQLSTLPESRYRGKKEGTMDCIPRKPIN